MSNFKLLFLAPLLLLGWSGSAQSLSMQVIASGGDAFSGGGYTLTTTAAELTATTLTGASLLLTQGFQQPDDGPTAVENRSDDGTLRLFPNPAVNSIRLLIADPKLQDLRAVLYDISGRALQEHLDQNAGAAERSIVFNLDALAPSVYVIRLEQADGSAVHSFRFQKTE